MKTTFASCLLLASIATGAWAATCLPVVNTPITVDGIVAGADLGVPVHVPASCPNPPADNWRGWGGVAGRGIDLVAGTPGTEKATLLFAAHQGGGANMDKIHFAVHVENAPDFTTNDFLTIYFQANAANGSFGANDFALSIQGIGPAAATPLGQDGCGSPGGTVLYYTFDTGSMSWVPQALPATISLRTSFAYDQVNDPQFQVWELEIGIDVSSLNIANNAQVGLGAKLYLFQAGAGGGTTAYHYPGPATDAKDLTPTPDQGFDFNPNAGGVTPATLDKVTVGNCTFDVVISGQITGSDDQGNPGQFTVLDPNNNNDFDQQTGAAKRQNSFSATVLFTNPANAGDTSTVAVANSGNVRFDIQPYNVSNVPTGTFTMQTVPTSFTKLGTPQALTIKWPVNKTQWLATNGLLNTAGHTCLIVDLLGFTVDLPTGNHQQINLAYVSASTIKERFLISVPKEPIVAEETPKGGIEYILRAHWDNLPPKFQTGSKPFKYRITNASAIGLKSIGHGYYAVRLKPGDQKRVMLEITGGEMPHPNVQYKLSAKAGGDLLQPASGEPPLAIPVKPGSIVSILARGLINVEKHPPSNAGGYAEREPVRERFLLPGEYYRPEDYVGAVVASCDKFRTGFVVGTDSTFVIPEHCDTLFLAVNYIAGRYTDNKGAFDVNVVVGDPVFLPARLPPRGLVANPKFGVPAQMQPGSMLPQLVVDVAQRFKKPKFYRLIPTGYVAYAIYESHP